MKFHRLRKSLVAVNKIIISPVRKAHESKPVNLDAVKPDVASSVFNGKLLHDLPFHLNQTIFNLVSDICSQYPINDYLAKGNC